MSLGKVLSVEVNHVNVDVAKKGTEAAVKIAGNGNMIGRQFQATDDIFSLVCFFFFLLFCFCFVFLFSPPSFSFQITRESIDAIKENFREDITKEDLQLFVQLKKKFGII